MSELKRVALEIYAKLPEQVNVDDGLVRDASSMSADVGIPIVECQRVLLSIKRADAFNTIWEAKFPEEESIDLHHIDLGEEPSESKTDY